jgi:hypothetical protein
MVAHDIRGMAVVPCGGNIVAVVPTDIGRMLVVARLGDDGVVAVAWRRVVMPVGGEGGEVVRVHDPGESVERVGVGRHVGGHAGVIYGEPGVVHDHVVGMVTAGGMGVVVALG